MLASNDYLLLQVVIFLFPGMMGDFLLYHRCISIMLGDSGSYLNLYFSRQLHCLGLACESWPTFVGCGSNGSLIFIDFVISFWFAWFIC